MAEVKSLGERLLDNGIILLSSNLESDITGSIILDLLALKAKNPTKEIQLYISSFSADYLNVFALYDVIKSLPNPISTYCIGAVGATSVILLGLADKGKRYMLKSSAIYFREVLGIVNGSQQTDIEIVANEATRTRIAFEEILAKQCGKDVETIHKDLIGERKFTAQEAIEYGLIDEVL